MDVAEVVAGSTVWGFPPHDPVFFSLRASQNYIAVLGLLTRRNNLLAAGAKGNITVFIILSSSSPPSFEHCYVILFHCRLDSYISVFPSVMLIASVSPGLGLSRGVSVVHQQHQQQAPSKGRISNPGNPTTSST